MRAMFLLCLALVVAGCTTPGSPEDPTGETDPGGERSWKLLTWDQPGLYNAFPAPGTQAGYTVAHERADGIPIPPQALGGELGPMALRKLTWLGPQDDPRTKSQAFLNVREDGNVTAILDDGWNSSDAREVFLELARNVTRAEPAALDRWADRFVKSRETNERYRTGEGADQVHLTYSYHVVVEGPWRLGALVEELNRTQGALLEINPPSLRLDAGAWQLSIERAFREAARSGEDRTLQLGVNARNEALFLVGQPGELPDADAGEALNRTFEELDLPPPEPAHWRFRVLQPGR